MFSVGVWWWLNEVKICSLSHLVLCDVSDWFENTHLYLINKCDHRNWKPQPATIEALETVKCQRVWSWEWGLQIKVHISKTCYFVSGDRKLNQYLAPSLFSKLSHVLCELGMEQLLLIIYMFLCVCEMLNVQQN